ncbi:membrane transport protein-domain-containing protein [Mycena crocata]|nr:membrane transport protein-domain-containing protein [Mycena crocata]
MSSELFDGIVSSSKASTSVLLVLARSHTLSWLLYLTETQVYGYVLRKFDLISKEGESNITQLCTKLFLPALLFTEIGPLATASNLKKYWPIIPLSVFFQGIALGVALLSRMAGMDQQWVPMFIFNNVTSLPLLLISALAATGGLDPLVTPDRTLQNVLSTGRVYILINALVGNLMRFALGPYLMKERELKVWSNDLSETQSPEVGYIALPDEDQTTVPPRNSSKAFVRFRSAKDWAVRAINPPLRGGILAVCFGLIPWFHRELFGPGILSPISDSINNVGKLFSALQMLVLGAHLYSKKGSKVNPLLLAWLFTYRFVIAPAISISVVYYIRTTWPNLLEKDPMLDFVLAMSNVGPPALTLSAVAVMADLPSEIEGQVSRIITASYAVTPLISFPVTMALWMVKKTGVGRLN